MDNPTSQRVLSKAVAGDGRAIAELWRTWNSPLLRFFRARRAAEPDDLAQQVWCDVARRLSDFEGDPDAFRRWLFTLAHRRLIDAARVEGRRPTPGPLTERAERPAPGFESEVDGLDWALALLAQLPEKQAVSVALRVLGGMSVADVAIVMDEKEATVRVLTHRGLRRLERLLGADERSQKKPGVAVTPGRVASLTPIT